MASLAAAEADVDENALAEAFKEEVDESKVSAKKAGRRYSVSAKSAASVSDILAADAEDESLQKYKASLLGAAASGDLGDTSDTRRLVVVEFRIIFQEDVDDIVFDLSSEEGLAKLQMDGFTMKEGAAYKFALKFKVNHEILEGLRFINKTTTRGRFGRTVRNLLPLISPLDFE